jgi:hypothetical protein
MALIPFPLQLDVIIFFYLIEVAEGEVVSGVFQAAVEQWPTTYEWWPSSEKFLLSN